MARSCAHGALVSALVIGAAVVSFSEPQEAISSLGSSEGSAELGPAQEVRAGALTGLWSRFESEAEGGPVRFWYFHGNGKGLYRYGRVGLNTTNSFDYTTVGNRLELVFRKTGARHALRFGIETDAEGEKWLAMEGDPKEPGARYRMKQEGMTHVETVPSSSAGPDGRLWIDHENWATGGSGFLMYQLNDAAIDGRGVGWFHRGDFDDWSTESLTYRIDGDHLELFFDLREEPATSHFTLETDTKGTRSLRLQQDPRDYWSSHRYVDGGKSFGRAHVWHWVTQSGAVD